jgi:hypothetical protein
LALLKLAMNIAVDYLARVATAVDAVHDGQQVRNQGEKG